MTNNEFITKLKKLLNSEENIKNIKANQEVSETIEEFIETNISVDKEKLLRIII